MTCLNTEELMDYLFNECRSGKRKEIEEHCSACTRCRDELQTLKHTISAAAAMTPAPVSDDFTARLMRVLEEKNSARVPAAAISFRALFKPAYGLTFAALAVCLAIGGVIVKVKREPPQTAAKIIYMTDGPAVVNRSFFTSADSGITAARLDIDQAYTDSCKTAKCGIL